ncbi:lytic transglycosylase domain-containing protein [Pandoraea apista]|uniref:lytic transglycosylase domain-containing protein n=1 Tax=Pandoraea apista TaxID=93218 RepID=UPI00248EDFD8|nr:lytic transglycosylase domain-containing protein [Pandoraea apista]
MNVLQNPASGGGTTRSRSSRLIFLTVATLSLSLPAMAANRGLLPLHPRVADARLLVPEPRAVAIPELPLVDASVPPDALLPGKPDEPGPARVSAPAVAPEALPFDALVQRAAEVASVDAALLHAIIDVESGYDPQAVSGRGAIGLMQVLPRTGERFGVRRLEDPAENVRAGASYIRWLFSRFDGDLPLVLAAYNAGEGAVLRYGRQIPPFPETQSYVRKVMDGYSRLRTTNVPKTVEPPRRPVPPGRPAIRPGIKEIATTPPGVAPVPKTARADPPAQAAGTGDATANRTWRLLRGLGTLLTRSPSVEASGGRGRDQPAVLMP